MLVIEEEKEDQEEKEESERLSEEEMQRIIDEVSESISSGLDIYKKK